MRFLVDNALSPVGDTATVTALLARLLHHAHPKRPSPPSAQVYLTLSPEQLAPIVDGRLDVSSVDTRS